MSSKDSRAPMRRRTKPTKEEEFISGATAETSSAGGRQAPEDMQRINANIPSDLYRALKMQAVKEDRTMTDIITEQLRRYVEK